MKKFLNFKKIIYVYKQLIDKSLIILFNIKIQNSNTISLYK